MIPADTLRIVAVAELLLAVALAVTLLIASSWRARSDRRQTADMARGRPIMIATVTRDLTASEVAALERLGRRTQVRLLAEIAPSLSGERRARLGAVAARLGIARSAEAACRSRRWWRRLQGARLLTLIGSGDEVMPALLGDRHPLVRAQAAEWASDHPTAATLRLLVALLDDPHRIARFAVQDTLLRVGHPAIGVLAEGLLSMSARGIEAGLAVASRVVDPRLVPIAATLAEHDADSVRAAAARALGAQGGDVAVQVLTRLIEDEDPRVRAAAAASLGRLEHWPSATRLLPLLSDPSWGVRRESALALRAMGAPGAVILRTALTSEDRFAADIAAQALALRLGPA